MEYRQPRCLQRGKEKDNDDIERFWFDVKQCHETEIVLNYGTGVEIESENKDGYWWDQG
jgi:hypothetical protein